MTGEPTLSTEKALIGLATEWIEESKSLAFTGEAYDGGEDEANDAMSKVYAECAERLLRVIRDEESRS